MFNYPEKGTIYHVLVQQTVYNLLLPYLYTVPFNSHIQTTLKVQIGVPRAPSLEVLKLVQPSVTALLCT